MRMRNSKTVPSIPGNKIAPASKGAPVTKSALTSAPAKSGCMIVPQTEAELLKLRAEHPVSVDIYTDSRCPHCQAYKPEAEKACLSLRAVDKEGSIPVINCQVDKEFCAKDLQKAGGEGVPHTVARINVPSAMFVVHGNNPKELNGKIDELKSKLLATKKGTGDMPVGKERRK